MFELGQLRCFVAVADELHFGRAAARLNMTQPPLSRQIKLLEHALDASLFVRTSRSVRMTQAGRYFLPEAKRLLKIAEDAAIVAKSAASGKIGSLKLGFTAGAAQNFLPALVTECRILLPGVDLLLKEMVSGDQIDALESRQIDVCLLRPPVVRAEIDSFQVLSEPLLVAVPKGHRLAQRKGQISFKELHDEPFVMYAPFESRYFYDLLVSQFAKTKVLPRFVQHMSQIHSILALVGAGLGLALVPQSAARLHIERVVFRPIRMTPARPVELHMAWLRRHDSPLLPRFLAVTRNLAARSRQN